MAELKEAPRPKNQNGPGQTKEVAPRTAAPMKPSISPFASMRRFAEDMDHLFESFGIPSRFHWPRFLTRGHEPFRREPGFVPGEWSPKIDVLEREGHLVIRADLPGMSKDDVKVEIHENALTIHGERKSEKKDEREGYCYSECSYGSFYRAIPLPEGTDTSKAAADFRNGVLEVTVPVAARQESKTRRLEVKEGK
jgi:HSP20 family protein